MRTDDTATDRDVGEHELITSIPDDYWTGLEANDVSAVPFAEDVVWENPLTRRQGEPIRGRVDVVAALERPAANMPRIDVQRYVIDGRHACSIVEWEIGREGFMVPTVDSFEFADDAIVRNQTYFDLSEFDLSAVPDG